MQLLSWIEASDRQSGRDEIDSSNVEEKSAVGGRRVSGVGGGDISERKMLLEVHSNQKSFCSERAGSFGVETVELPSEPNATSVAA